MSTCGDELVFELIDSSTTAPPERTMQRCSSREQAISPPVIPDLASAFYEFARSQQDEHDYLDEHSMGAVWVLRRCDDDID